MCNNTKKKKVEKKMKCRHPFLLSLLVKYQVENLAGVEEVRVPAAMSFSQCDVTVEKALFL